MFEFTEGLHSIPTRFRDAEPDVELAAMLLEGVDLHIIGKVGTGKTRTACAILKGAVELLPELSIGYISAYALDRVDPDDHECQSEVVKLYDVDVLAIDGIDIGLCTFEGYETLQRVLKRRYPVSQHPITTSFNDGDELASSISKFSGNHLARAIVGRIQELSEVLHLYGPDRRLLG